MGPARWPRTTPDPSKQPHGSGLRLGRVSIHHPGIPVVASSIDPKEALLGARLRPNGVQDAVVQGLHSLLGKGALEMRGARVFNRREDPSDAVGERVDRGVELALCVLGLEGYAGPAGVDGDVEEGDDAGKLAVVVVVGAFLFVSFYVEAFVFEEGDGSSEVLELV